MDSFKTALLVTVSGAMVFGALSFKAYLNYCDQTEYFFVADSIVYPAGDSLEEAREMARRLSTRGDGEEWTTITFIGKKSRCEDIQVW
jgi:hypothetical protein